MTSGGNAKSAWFHFVLSVIISFGVLVMVCSSVVTVGGLVNSYRREKSLSAWAQRNRERSDKLHEVALSVQGYADTFGDYPSEIAQLVPSYIDVKKLFLDPENLLRRYPKLLGTPEEVREVVRNFGSYRLETRGALYLIEIGFDRQPSNLRINLETSKVSSGPWEYGEED